MSCEEVQTLLAAYALGALDPDEREAVQAHLDGDGPHAGCAEALARAQGTTAAIGRALPPMSPSPNVWRGIEHAIGLPQPTPAPRNPRSRRWLVALAAAAVALAFASLGLENAALTRQGQKLAQRLALATAQVAQAENTARTAQAEVSLVTSRCDARSEQKALTLLDRAGTQVVDLAPAKGSTIHATAIVNTRLHQAFVLGASMPTVADMDYELWVIRGKAAPRAAGLLRVQNGVMVGEIDPALLTEAPDAIAVSLERKGGVASPTDVKAVGALRS